MNSDFVFALYVFCQDYHGGQWSRLYRISCRLDKRYHPRLNDWAYKAIRNAKHDPYDEWIAARMYYKQLKRKYAGDKR